MATAVSGSQINLIWADNSANETGFQIERCEGEGCTTFAQIASLQANVSSYANTSLTAGTTYTYRVRAYNAAGNSDYSNTTGATTEGLAPALPAAPSALTATAVSSSIILLTWTDNSNNETGFRVERCEGQGCNQFRLAATVGANVVTYTNNGLDNGNEFAYRIRAYNEAGNSAPSNTARATTPQ
jgi:tripartite motif-containing protein 71